MLKRAAPSKTFPSYDMEARMYDMEVPGFSQLNPHPSLFNHQSNRTQRGYRELLYSMEQSTPSGIHGGRFRLSSTSSALSDGRSAFLASKHVSCVIIGGLCGVQFSFLFIWRA